MQRLYIQGLVRVAERTRTALSRGVSSAELGELQEYAAGSLRTVDQLIARQGHSVAALPGPTRKAYRYLAGINWQSVQADTSKEGSPTECGRIRFSGLSSSFERLLTRLSDLQTTEDCFKAICTTTRRLHEDMSKDGIALDQLTTESSEIVSWFTFFCRRENFDRLVSAIESAKGVLTTAFEKSRRFATPVVIHFRTMKGLYRVRRYQDGTLAQLPAAMICFDAKGLTSLAAAICGESGERQRVLECASGEAYRAMQSALDGATSSGHTNGAFHNLDAAFNRVNATYFDRAMAKPRFTWSERITSCKFGHYDSLRDEIMISATLDSRDVPAYVLDFVVYHELLHKKHGASWREGRRLVHTPAFKEDERRFSNYETAEADIKKLAKRFAQ